MIVVRVPPLERLDEIRDLLDELGCDLPVLSGALGEPELPGEEVEERGVPQLDPPAALVEVRQCDQKLGEGTVLAAEERGEVLGECACSIHEPSVSRDSPASGNAPGRPERRERGGPAADTLAHLARARSAAERFVSDPLA
jgi:hypothetical protein